MQLHCGVCKHFFWPSSVICLTYSGITSRYILVFVFVLQACPGIEREPDIWRNCMAMTRSRTRKGERGEGWPESIRFAKLRRLDLTRNHEWWNDCDDRAREMTNSLATPSVFERILIMSEVCVRLFELQRWYLRRHYSFWYFTLCFPLSSLRCYWCLHLYHNHYVNWKAYIS